LYEIEGYPGRIVKLFHVTNPQAAKLIVDDGRMLRGQTGLFGGGIYFAED